MEHTEQYRQHAAEALERARRAPDERTRGEWLNIAVEWHALAKARMVLIGPKASDFAPSFEQKKGQPN